MIDYCHFILDLIINNDKVSHTITKITSPSFPDIFFMSKNSIYRQFYEKDIVPFRAMISGNSEVGIKKLADFA